MLPAEITRANEALMKIEPLIKCTNAILIPQAQAKNVQSFVASGRLLRLSWHDSSQKPGFYDCPLDNWPEGQRPDHTKLQGAALLLWLWLEQYGWAPQMERDLPRRLCFETLECKVSGGFRGYFFYICINWQVTLT